MHSPAEAREERSADLGAVLQQISLRFTRTETRGNMEEIDTSDTARSKESGFIENFDAGILIQSQLCCTGRHGSDARSPIPSTRKVQAGRPCSPITARRGLGSASHPDNRPKQAQSGEACVWRAELISR